MFRTFCFFSPIPDFQLAIQEPDKYDKNSQVETGFKDITVAITTQEQALNEGRGVVVDDGAIDVDVAHVVDGARADSRREEDQDGSSGDGGQHALHAVVQRAQVTEVDDPDVDKLKQEHNIKFNIILHNVYNSYYLTLKTAISYQQNNNNV